MITVSEQEFEERLKHKLLHSWPRARDLFLAFSPDHSSVMLNTLQHAVVHAKVDEVLDILEGFHASHPPPAVITTASRMQEIQAEYRTIEMTFTLIRRDVLGLQ